MPKARPIEEAFWEKVDIRSSDECWPWLARCSKTSGYGMYTYPRPSHKTTSAHRVAYELTFGPLPSNLDAGHQCGSILCCNPQHLLPETWKVNRGQPNGSKLTCKNGHPYNDVNTYVNKGKRFCRVCNRERAARLKRENPDYAERQRALSREIYQRKKTFVLRLGG